MTARYHCESTGRRQAVAASSTVNGIDFVEVDPGQTMLRVFFIHDLPGTGPTEIPPGRPELEVSDISITGGVRVVDPEVVAVTAVDNVLEVEVATPGDFSTYTLRLGDADAAPPAGFDPRLAAADFSFKATCPGDFDCKQHVHCPPEVRSEPDIDYLNKDYGSFRRLMLERLAAVTPGWTDRSPADLQITMVELLAYLGDQFSYRQDAVGTEAYLGTARRRVSVRRHARFLDYVMHEGCNARAWLVFEVAGPVVLPTGTAVFTGDLDDVRLDGAKLSTLVADAGPTVFETTAPATLRPGHQLIDFHTWSDDRCCLPTGSTSATLRNDPPVTLTVGDVLILEEIADPETGLEADADPRHRHAVRLTSVEAGTDPVTGVEVVDVSWHQDDALPFALCIDSQIIDAQGALDTVTTAVARANVVLADHGYTPRSTVTGQPVPEALGPAPADRPFRPRLADGPLTVQGLIDPTAPAGDTMTCDVRQARPAVRIRGGGRHWVPVLDLLASDRFATDFVVEFETDRRAQIRFGDDVHGRAPSPGEELEASYRIGSGPAGNVGADRLNHVAYTGPGELDLISVRNPLPAVGGTEPESIRTVRYAAPQAMRTQRRAVTEDDYARMAAAHPDIQQAKASLRWTGSWYTVFVAVDPLAGVPFDDGLEEELLDRLDVVRMMGQDLEITPARYVPLDIALHVCVAPGHYRSDVAAALTTALGSGRSVSGARGLFHPDNFSFGNPVHLSNIYQVALGVAGVLTARAERFKRWGEIDRGELAAAVLQPADREIIRLDNDPSQPEMGHLELSLDGGL